MLETDSPSDPSRQPVEGTWRRRKTEFFAGRIVVKLRATADDSPASLERTCHDICSGLSHGRVLRAVTPTRRVVLEIDAGASVPQAARELSRRDDVEFAEPDMVDRAAVVPTDTRYSQQWAHPILNSEAAWDLETGNASIVLGVVDSGISYSGGALSHPDLSGPRFVLGTDFVDGGTPADAHGHGTHVAGIASAVSNNGTGVAGMNWGAEVYVCRVFDAANSGSSADFADAVEEITDYAISTGRKAVINYSGGGPDNQTKKDACNYASSNGMLLCAATGNDYGGPVIFPAAYSTTIAGVVAVGSTNSTDAVSNFSNVGPEVTVVAPGGQTNGPGLGIAPGEGIMSTLPTYPVTAGATNYGQMVGTSMATPLVSGLAALMWARHPSFTNQKIKDCLTDSAVKLGAGNFNNAWGFGRIDAEQALQCGDIVIVNSVISPGCNSVFCPSKLLDCVSRLTVRCPPSVVIVCPTVPHLCATSRFVPDCRPTVAFCPTVQEFGCPSTPSVNCAPTSIPRDCPGFTTAVGPDCNRPTTVECPSTPSVDCAPSTIPRDCVFTTAVGPDCTRTSTVECSSATPACTVGGVRDWRVLVEHQLGARRATSSGPSEARDEWYDAAGRWYFVDEAGRRHTWDPGGGDQADPPTE